MELGGLQWGLITIVGFVLLAAVLFWAMRRNKAEKGGEERTEAATSRLYKEEDAARDPMDDGTV